jgi:hypothetical protein
MKAKRIAAAQQSHDATGAARMISICRIANTRLIWHGAAKPPCERLGNPSVRFVGNRIKHRMNEDRYSQFIPDQQAGSEKTQEDNQDLECHTTFLPRAASFWVPG